MKLKKEDKHFLIFVFFAVLLIGVFAAYHGKRAAKCVKAGGEYRQSFVESVCIKSKIENF